MGVVRRCLGPYLRSSEDEKADFQAWREIEGEGEEKDALRMIQRLVDEAADNHADTGFVVRSRPVVDGNWESLRRAAFPFIRLRSVTVGKGCGWNLSEEIIEHPFDGAEHVTVCPNCGIDISWKAPVF